MQEVPGSCAHARHSRDRPPAGPAGPAASGTLTPVICPPASMSWVCGRAAGTDGCGEGWLGCWASPVSSLGLD